MPYVIIRDRLEDPTGIWILLTSGAWFPLDTIHVGPAPLNGVQFCLTWEDAVHCSRQYGGPLAGNRILTARSAGVSPPPV